MSAVERLIAELCADGTLDRAVHVLTEVEAGVIPDDLIAGDEAVRRARDAVESTR